MECQNRFLQCLEGGGGGGTYFPNCQFSCQFSRSTASLALFTSHLLCYYPQSVGRATPVLEFLKNLWGLGTE
jgi:hypothetical protein